MTDAVNISAKAFLDPKLIAFKALSMVPYQPLQSYARRGYFGRRRAYVSVDLELILSKLPENPVIVDLGANEGTFSRLVVRKAAEVHAFEPDPLTFERLRRNLAGHDNVRLHNVAVGAEDGEIEFYRGADFVTDPDSASLSSSTIPDHDSVDLSSSFKVPQIGIVSLIKGIGKPIDLLKMDIEGSEVSVLEKLLSEEVLGDISYVLVETHEHCIPSLVDRTYRLRCAAQKLSRPKIVMDWY